MEKRIHLSQVLVFYSKSDFCGYSLAVALIIIIIIVNIYCQMPFYSAVYYIKPQNSP